MSFYNEPMAGFARGNLPGGGGGGGGGRGGGRGLRGGGRRYPWEVVTGPGGKPLPYPSTYRGNPGAAGGKGPGGKGPGGKGPGGTPRPFKSTYVNPRQVRPRVNKFPIRTVAVATAVTAGSAALLNEEVRETIKDAAPGVGLAGLAALGVVAWLILRG